jgi:hypothetical protein
MPLIDLKTNLKSLKYGNDRTNAGSSGQPYVTTDPDGNTNLSLGANNVAGDVLRLIGVDKIPLVPNLSVKLNESNVGKFVNQVLNTDDFIRGGAVGSVQASINDAFRIGAFLTDTPKGSIFIAKQVGLQLSNPKLEIKKGGAAVAKGIIKAIFSGSPAQALSSVTGGLLGPTRVYNAGINTLAQVPSNAFGIHFSRHGLLPIQDEQTKYQNVVTYNNESTNSKNNRLVELKDKFDLGDQVYEPNPNFNLRAARKANRQANRTNRKKIQSSNATAKALAQTSGLPYVPIKFKKQKLDISKQTIAAYPSGPGSVYGIGTTVIQRYSFSEDKLKIDESLEQASLFGGKSRTSNSGQVFYFNALGEKAKLSINTAAKAIGFYDPSSIPNTFTQVNALGLSPGSIAIQGAITQGTVATYADLLRNIGTTTNATQSIPAFGTYTSINNIAYSGSITATNPLLTRDASNYRYYGTGSKVDASGSILQYENTNVFKRNDNAILSVIFRAINPFDANSSSNQETWAFNAYMTGYKDDFNATWNDVNYVGRSESFYIYSKFKRTVNFNLKIPCFNKTQLFEKHRALGQLASVTAGSYGNNSKKDGVLLGGVLIKINLGNYLVGEYAVLNNVSYSIPDDASWDIADDALLSMYIEASFNLTIVHKNLPEYRQSGAGVLDNGFFGHLPNPVNSTQATKTGYIASPSVISKFSKD